MKVSFNIRLTDVQKKMSPILLRDLWGESQAPTDWPAGMWEQLCAEDTRRNTPQHGVPLRTHTHTHTYMHTDNMSTCLFAQTKHTQFSAQLNHDWSQKCLVILFLDSYANGDGGECYPGHKICKQAWSVKVNRALQTGCSYSCPMTGISVCAFWWTLWGWSYWSGASLAKTSLPSDKPASEPDFRRNLSQNQ